MSKICEILKFCDAHVLIHLDKSNTFFKIEKKENIFAAQTKLWTMAKNYMITYMKRKKNFLMKKNQ